MASNMFAKMVAASVASEKGELSIADDFELEFSKYFNDKVKERAKHVSFSLKPSQIKACVRMLWYYQNMPEGLDAQGPINLDLQMTAEVGSAFHTTMQEMLADMTTKGYRIRVLDVPKYVESLPARGINTKVISKNGTEWKLRNEGLLSVPFSFQLDNLIDFREKIMIWDLKTTDQRTLQGLIEPRAKDKEQLVGYVLLMGIPGVLFTYLARDTGKRRHFYWVPSDEEKQEVFDRVSFQAHAIQQRDLPDYEQNRCKASYCPFHKQCKLDGGVPA